jgi:uncharacterized repeat protein (TIGR02543 family)
MVYFNLVGGNMKRGIISILAVLTVFAMITVSCPEPEPEPEPTPEGIIVYFNKNGGTTDASPRYMRVDKDVEEAEEESGEEGEEAKEYFLEDWPIPPTRTGYGFTRWNTSPDGSGEDFTLETPVTESVTVYAQWGHVVTFNRNNNDTDGFEEADPKFEFSQTPSHLIKELPTPPIRSAGWGAGMTFNGWNTKADGSGTAFTAETLLDKSIEVYAQWKFEPGEAEVIGIRLVHDGPRLTKSTSGQTEIYGDFSGTENYNGSITFRSGAVLYPFPEGFDQYDFVQIDYVTTTPANDAREFKVILKQYGKGDDYIPREGDQWPSLQPNGSLKLAIVNSGGTNGIAIQFNTQGGVSNGTFKITKVTFERVPRRWKLSFDTNGGVPASITPMEVSPGIPFTQRLPTPTRTGYSFRGWKDLSNRFITNLSYYSEISSDLTLEAQWAAKPGTVEPINVNFNGNLEGRGTGFTESGATAVANDAGTYYTLTYGTANGYKDTWVKFNITLASGVSLGDYGTVTFTLEGLAGDRTYKNIEVLGAVNLGTEDKPIVTSNNTSVITYPTYIQYRNASTSMTFNLDQTITAPMAVPGPYEISIYIPANYSSSNTSNGNTIGTTQFKISDVKFTPRP